ncbi:MAG: dodecin domain-containing protein [Gammaproteobacteria bacterium]|nr:dodecin domain-containing protein [Gammaproteobacteria bacterium]
MLKHTKSNELIGTSQRSFEDALQTILARANQTLRGVRCLDVIARDLEVHRRRTDLSGASPVAFRRNATR